MIAALSGTLLLRDDPYIILSVNGVGYKVFATRDVFAQPLKIGDKLEIFTYTHVREDLLDLYGFAKYEDLKIFEMLLGVSGIGPKTAVGVFSLGKSQEIVAAIANGNVEFFSGVPRLGKKNAQKIIIELKNKIGSSVDLDLSGVGTEHSDVIAALKTFGFSAKEAADAIREIAEEGLSTEEMIRKALKYLGK